MGQTKYCTFTSFPGNIALPGQSAPPPEIYKLFQEITAMSDSRNPMQVYPLDILGGVDTQIDVDTNDQVKVTPDVVAIEAFDIINELEYTHLINLENLPQ